jgi:hypothetical protein
MELKASRMVADRVSISKTVIAAIDNHGPEVVPILEKLLFPGGAPANLDMAGFLGAIRQHLAQTTEKLVNDDTLHALELLDDDPHRRERDESVVELRALLVSFRSTFTTNYGPEVASAYGLGAAIPEEANVLVLLAANVEELLRTRALTETSKKKSLTVNPIDAADDIKASRESVETALAHVERERRESQLTQAAKNDSMDDWSIAYPRSADVIAALFALAGRDELAHAVRPTARRRAGLPESPDAPDAPPPAPAEPATGG